MLPAGLNMQRCSLQNLIIILIVFVLETLTGCSILFAQSQNSPQNYLECLSRSAAEYKKRFSNLLADEERTLIIYDKNEEPKSKTQQTSLFLIYTDQNGRQVEFRNIQTLNGIKINDADSRTESLFNALQNKDAKIFETLEKETTRFEKEFIITGLTINQAIAVDPKLRDSFSFEYLGTTKDGLTTIYYSQIKPSRLIAIEPVKNDESQEINLFDFDTKGDKKDLQYSLSGKLFIDSTTCQIASEQRQLNVKMPHWQKSLVAISEEFTYKNSKFGLMLPARIKHTQWLIDIKKASARLDLSLEMNYSDFSEPSVDVKASDPNPQKP